MKLTLLFSPLHHSVSNVAAPGLSCNGSLPIKVSPTLEKKAVYFCYSNHPLDIPSKLKWGEEVSGRYGIGQGKYGGAGIGTRFMQKIHE